MNAIKSFKDLIGKTITAAQQMKLDGHDDTGFLKLDFSDGSTCVVEGNYGGYTGESEDEYPTRIYIMTSRKTDQLIPIQ